MSPAARPARGGALTPSPPSPPSQPGGSRRRVAGERSRRPAQPASAPAARPAPAKPPASATRPARPAGPVAPDRPARPGWRSRWLLAALAGRDAVAVAAAVVLTVQAREAARLSDARTAALQSARSAAEVVLSYDHEHLDEDFAAALELSTGAFADEYRRTSENAVRQVAEDTAATVTAEVASAGVVSATADEVVVLLFVDQTTTSNRLDAPQTDQNRVRFTMVRSGDRWLVAGVDAL